MAFDLALGADQGAPMNMFWGRKQVIGVYWGTDALWTQPVISITSDIGDSGLLSEIAAWVDEIPIIGPFVGAGIAFLGQLIQMLIPDGLAEVLGTITSIMRSEGTTDTDDNFVEVVVGSMGYQGLITDVLAHYPGNGSSSQGIGFRLVDSTLSLVERSNPLDLGAVTNVMAGAGLYNIGSRIRLESYSELHYHQLFLNGDLVCFYEDAGTLTLGAGYRTVALMMQAEIATVGGARSTSPNFVSLIAGDLQTNFSLSAGGSGSAGGADAPTTTGGDDLYDFTDVSAAPGGAGSVGGVDHTWSVVLPSWLSWIDQ